MAPPGILCFLAETHIGPVPDTKPPVLLGDDDVENKYEVEKVLDVQNVE